MTESTTPLSPSAFGSHAAPSTTAPAAPSATATATATAANPTPTTTNLYAHNHPPYAEMITAAIGALNEKNGSSRTAIAKFIEQAYSDLPSTHLVLLAHHLKRLRNSGHIIMVKHSYALPRSGDPNLNGSGQTSLGLKRGRGRPPKPTLDIVPILPEPIPESGFFPVSPLNGPKRGRGRPPKSGGPSPRPRPVFSDGSKRSRGRPPKPKGPKHNSISILMGSTGLKKGPGRPPMPKPTILPHSGGNALFSTGRPRGRPKKIPGTATAVAAGGFGGGGNVLFSTGRPRGRPKNIRATETAVAGGGVGGGGVKVAKRRGRPPQFGRQGVFSMMARRAVGRPKKNSKPSGSGLVNAEDIKRKFEYYQSRIKQVVVAIKPHLRNEAAINGVAVLRELEEIANVDINAPVNVAYREEPEIHELDHPGV